MKKVHMDEIATKKTLWGLTALAAGAVTFWLLTRKETKDKIGEAAYKMKDVAEEYGERAGEYAKSIKAKVTKSEEPQTI